MLFCKDTNIDVLFTNFSMRPFGYGWGVLIIFWIAFHFQFCLASVAALAFSIINKHRVLFMSFEFSPESMRDRTCFWFLSSQDHTIWQPSTPGNMWDITPQRYMLLQGFFSDRVLFDYLATQLSSFWLSPRALLLLFRVRCPWPPMGAESLAAYG